LTYIPSTTTLGSLAEDAAIKFLTKQDLHLIERNFRSRYGEIDLIMKDAEIIVFVEVRYRKNKKYLDPLETINSKKVKHIINTCNFYIQKSNTDNRMYRIDIITLSGNLETPEIQWYQNAFTE
jgi:putative endonuclease